MTNTFKFNHNGQFVPFFAEKGSEFIVTDTDMVYDPTQLVCLVEHITAEQAQQIFKSVADNGTGYLENFRNMIYWESNSEDMSGDLAWLLPNAKNPDDIFDNDLLVKRDSVIIKYAHGNYTLIQIFSPLKLAQRMYELGLNAPGGFNPYINQTFQNEL